MEKNAYPLVICYNGRDHYVPTKPTTYQHFYAWKTEKELVPILSARLLVIEEMDLQFISDEQKEACNELEAWIIKHLPTPSAQVNAAHHGMAARAPGRGTCGPFFQQVSTGQIPSASGKSSLPPAPPRCTFCHSFHTSHRPWRRCSSSSKKEEKTELCVPFMWVGIF